MVHKVAQDQHACVVMPQLLQAKAGEQGKFCRESVKVVTLVPLHLGNLALVCSVTTWSAIVRLPDPS